ncbi:hypothetical protein CALVIDRAFT_538752 [Calocera viscosa TUFC12733]|uniref:Uncharacterized protein n=1 Tax=Calocera viscosa (strain TUFC12733) TaxID=1330018 RepID=A0A167KGN7_CALVF|nr:hypothetical protein CALVIDRAFT_538752 [Calocera viscosa TUFC12733]
MSLATTNDRYSTQLLHDLALKPQSSRLKVLTFHLTFQEVPWQSIVCFTSLECLRIAKPSKDDFSVTGPFSLSSLTKKGDQGDGPPAWRLPMLHTLILEATATEIGVEDSCSSDSTSGQTHFGADMEACFKDRWAAAHGMEEIVAVLDIDMIGSNWKVEIRHSDRSNDSTKIIAHVDNRPATRYGASRCGCTRIFPTIP